MITKRIRILAAATAMMLFAMVGAGCSPQVVTPAATTTAATTAATTKPAGSTTAAGTTAATTSALSGKIVAAGSTSMEKVMKALGETFTKVNPGVSVEIQGGGSGAGVTAAAARTADLGNASRHMTDAEKTKTPTLVETVVAIDGIAIVINPANTVKALTSKQIADIFTGVIKNWKEVGGADKPIAVIIRESGSGTRDGFEGILNIAGKTVPTQEVNETGIVKSTVAGNAQAIGYMSLGEIDSSVVAVGVDGIAATEANVKNTTYKIQRDFVCITNGQPTGLTKTFLDYILSSAGQAVVVSQGFVKLG